MKNNSTGFGRASFPDFILCSRRFGIAVLPRISSEEPQNFRGRVNVGENSRCCLKFHPYLDPD